MRLHSLAGVALTLLAAFPAALRAELPDLSLEELLKTEVTTASRKAQALFDVPAAAFVLSADDIRRSGATNLPEALRLVPGVEVAQLASGQWAVTVRGANGRFANKLLVLMDGRSIYSPLFSGTLWEIEGVLPQDIDRIEVIRGPGAAVWGANAVNGVINIITRRASATVGTTAFVRAGSPEMRALGLRHGAPLGDNWHLRAEASAEHEEPALLIGGGDGGHRDAQRFALRADGRTERGRRSLIATHVQGKVVSPIDVPLLTAPYSERRAAEQKTASSSVLLREELVLDGGSEVVVQASAALTDIELLGIDNVARQFDIDAQQRLPLRDGHELVWGGAWRGYSDELGDQFPLEFSTASARTNRWSGFAQYDWTLVPDRWRLSVGARVDRETGTSAQMQPNVRLLWLPAAGQTFWASAGQASRLMARAERDAEVTLAVLPPNPPTVPLPVQICSKPGETQPERLAAFEAGYRGELGAQVFIDAVLYEHRLSRLRGNVPASVVPATDLPLRLVSPIITTNVDEARVRGVELFAEWRPARGLRLQAGGNWMTVSEIEQRERSPGGVGGNSPRWQVFARGSFDPRPGHAIDLIAKRVAALPIGPVPAYTRLDLRYAMKIGADSELALVGQNLLDPLHPEIAPDFLSTVPVEVRRSAYLRLAVRF